MEGRVEGLGVRLQDDIGLVWVEGLRLRVEDDVALVYIRNMCFFRGRGEVLYSVFVGSYRG